MSTLSAAASTAKRRSSKTCTTRSMACVNSSFATATAFGSRSLNPQLKRLEILHQITLLLVRQPQVEALVIAVHHVQQRLESPIMIKAAFVLRKHEQSPFANKQAGQVHRLVCMAGRAVGLKAVDLHLLCAVLVPSRLRPQGLVMATVAVGLAAEELIPARCCLLIKVNARTRSQSRQCQLIEVQRRQLRRYLVFVGIH